MPAIILEKPPTKQLSMKRICCSDDQAVVASAIRVRGFFNKRLIPARWIKNRPAADKARLDYATPTLSPASRPYQVHSANLNPELKRNILRTGIHTEQQLMMGAGLQNNKLTITQLIVWCQCAACFTPPIRMIPLDMMFIAMQHISIIQQRQLLQTT